MMSANDVINGTIDRSVHTVLVVEDNPATCCATARVIRAAGFHTVETGKGADALKLAGSGVSAVVLDIELADVDGFEVCRAIRSQAETASLPVILFSAVDAKNEDRLAGFNAGADAFLTHPAEPAILIATLQALIRARMAEDSLRRSEMRFRAIYSQAQSGMTLIDAEGRFADMNPAMAGLLGRRPEELLGRRISEFAPPEWAAFVTQKTAGVCDNGAPWGGEFPLVKADGTWVHLEWRMSSHVEPGLRIGVALDISERIQLERRRWEMLEREQAARAIAEQHSRAKDDFIAVLSHELRTPLNSIVGWVHIIKRRGGTPEIMKGMEAIERSVKTQARIISDILDVSRINSGKLRLEHESTDPAELVAASLSSLRSTIDEKNLTVKLEVSGQQGGAWLDPARFQQIFWNLMTNAVKFSNNGGEIRVTLAREGDVLLMTVQDFGLGIRPEFMDQLFDRFSQSDSPGNRHHGGLGLGLSIVKHLVELHGGTIEVHSDGVGRGTAMRVQLPVVPPLDPARKHGAPVASEEEVTELSGQPLAGVDVLVVDDDRDTCEMLSVVLADRGARVRIGVDFETAMQALRQEWPDVLVSDIGLPGRDGYELMRRVRQSTPPDKPRLPAIALTAFTRPEDQASAFKAGFDAHLAKPLKPHELIGAMARMVRPRFTGPKS
jgi:PAS domain S-box-containing protein